MADPEHNISACGLMNAAEGSHQGVIIIQGEARNGEGRRRVGWIKFVEGVCLGKGGGVCVLLLLGLTSD